MVTNLKRRSGFTMVELMLAMAFVSVLLLSIATLGLQVSSIYNRGMTLKAVNQAGTTISYDIQRSLNSANPAVIESIAFDDGSGRLCLGEFSYVWNSGKTIDMKKIDASVQVVNSYSGTEANDTIRFAKVYDKNGALCAADSEGNPSRDPIVKADSTELLEVSDRELAIQSMAVSSYDDRVYTITFVIGTNDGKALNNNTGCKAPGEDNSDTDYCAINQFEVIATVEKEL